MQSDSRIYSLPRWRVTRWLADCGAEVPEDIRVALIGNLYGTLPVFIGGILNTLLVAAAIAARSPTPLFIAWLALEIAICLTRLTVLIVARRRALRHDATPTDINLVLSIAWSGSVGYGALISLATGDWVAATLACVSAGAMVGGICFRNFSAPRLCGAMIVLSLGPTIPGALMAGQPLMLVLFFQIPMYLAAMTMACFKLNRLLIATMRAERENDRRARHDELTGLANRAGLVGASRWSTTRTATPGATDCCRASPSACVAWPAKVTCRRASAVTNSSCSSQAAPRNRRRILGGTWSRRSEFRMISAAARGHTSV